MCLEKTIWPSMFLSPRTVTKEPIFMLLSDIKAMQVLVLWFSHDHDSMEEQLTLENTGNAGKRTEETGREINSKCFLRHS